MRKKAVGEVINSWRQGREEGEAAAGGLKSRGLNWRGGKQTPDDFLPVSLAQMVCMLPGNLLVIPNSWDASILKDSKSKNKKNFICFIS